MNDLNIKLNTHKNHDLLEIILCGSLTGLSSQTLNETIAQNQHHLIILNLDDLNILDLAGFNALVMAHFKAASSGRKVLFKPTSQMQFNKWLHLTKMKNILNIA